MQLLYVWELCFPLYLLLLPLLTMRYLSSVFLLEPHKLTQIQTLGLGLLGNNLLPFVFLLLLLLETILPAAMTMKMAVEMFG